MVPPSPHIAGECELLQPLDLVTFSAQPHAPGTHSLDTEPGYAATEVDGACTAAKHSELPAQGGGFTVHP